LGLSFGFLKWIIVAKSFPQGKMGFVKPPIRLKYCVLKQLSSSPYREYASIGKSFRALSFRRLDGFFAGSILNLDKQQIS